MTGVIGELSTVKTEGLTVIDDVEDGDISEYTVNSTGTPTGASTNRVWEGTYSIVLTGQAASDSSIVSQSGLPYYPTRGDTIRWYNQQDTASAQSRFGFFWSGTGMRSSGSGYSVYINVGDNEFGMFRWDDGDGVENPTDSVSLSYDTWYLLEADTSATDIVANLYDTDENLLVSVSLSDTAYDSGGIGMDYEGSNSDGSSVWYDYIHAI